MNKRLAYLAYRRLALQETIAAQRIVMAGVVRDLHQPLAMADMGFRAVQLIRAHPVLTTGSVTALLIWRRKGVIGLVRHGWRKLLLYPSAAFLGLKYAAMAMDASRMRQDSGNAERTQP